MDAVGLKTFAWRTIPSINRPYEVSSFLLYPQIITKFELIELKHMLVLFANSSIKLYNTLNEEGCYSWSCAVSF